MKIFPKGVSLVVVFSSGVFMILFLPTLLILYYVFAKSRAAKNSVLLITSLIFYAWGEPVFVFVMILSIFINWYLALLMASSHRHKKFFMVTAISLDVLLIFVFKYASFISSNIAMLTGNASWKVNIALPIGISFFTFQIMSYVFDVYYGSTKAQKNPFYVRYISHFSHS